MKNNVQSLTFNLQPRNRRWSLLTRAATAILCFGLPAAMALVSGCTSVINDPQGKIISITERGIGFKVAATSATTQTPEVWFGFFSSQITFEPTSTNAPIYAPNFANTFDFAQSSALDLGIGETLASGSYETLQPGETNSSLVAEPVAPK
jgi:hypothetical protein